MLSLDFSALQQGPIEGRFGRFELPALLVRVARTGRTGRLALGDGTADRTIGFADGLPTLAGSRIPAEHLGQRLLKLDLISAEQLAQVDNLMCSEPLQFGEAMKRLGFVREDELRRTLRTHHNWVLTQALAVEEVNASFAPYAWVPHDPSGLALLPAIEDGVRGYGTATVRELITAAEGWCFTMTAEALALAHKLGCTKATGDALERLQGSPRSPEQVIEACGDDAAAVAGLALLLCGLFQATPIKHPVTVPVNRAVPATHSEPVAAAMDSVLSSPAMIPEMRVAAVMHRAPDPEAISARPERRLIVYAFVGVGLALGVALGAIFVLPHKRPPSVPNGIAADKASPEPALVTAPPKSLVVNTALTSDAVATKPATRDDGTAPTAAAAAVTATPHENHPVASEPPKPPQPTTAPVPAAKTPPTRPGTGVTRPQAPAPAVPAPPTTPAAVASAASDTEPDALTQDLRSCARLQQQGDYVQSVTACQRVLAVNPRHALAYRYLGIAYTKLGVRAQACESYRRYLRFAGNPPDRAQVAALLTACD